MSQAGFYFNPNGQGLEVFLGPTEAKLMELAWEKNNLTVKKALFFMEGERTPAYTTVMTILGRLADKGLLKRTKIGRSFEYEPAISKDDYLKLRCRAINKSLKQFKAFF